MLFRLDRILEHKQLRIDIMGHSLDGLKHSHEASDAHLIRLTIVDIVSWIASVKTTGSNPVASLNNHDNYNLIER